jgi:hypothetical protein
MRVKMIVNLIDVDGITFPNLALMKISSYHKQKGDEVDWHDPLFSQPDLCYASKLFTYTNDYDYFPSCKVIKGGTGYDVKSKLPEEIEQCDPDYTIYNKDFSLQLFSRGCIRKCKFCVVPEKEGCLRPVKPMEINPNGQYVEILDNNFFANPEWKKSVDWIINNGQPVNIHGIDIRIMTKDHADALNEMKHLNYIKIAWDNPKHNMLAKLLEITDWIKAYKFLCYVLIGYDSTPLEDLYRVEALRMLGICPFVMPYDKNDDYQKRFARWVNRHAIFKAVAWEDYNR